jgi:hypothetical protein
MHRGGVPLELGVDFAKKMVGEFVWRTLSLVDNFTW